MGRQCFLRIAVITAIAGPGDFAQTQPPLLHLRPSTSNHQPATSLKPTLTKIAGSVTRHTMTAGGVAGAATTHNDTVQLLSLLVTLAGIVWSIVEKLNRPTPKS